MNIQQIRRISIIVILTASAIIAVAITYTSYKEKRWETVASSMAVITAVLAIWSSLNLTWRQEDEKQAQINLYIDDTSHKFAYSLIIINKGGSPAYNVKLDWIIPIKDYEDKVPRFTDFKEAFDFDYLPTEIPYSRFLLGADDFRKLAESNDKPLHYEGTVSYSVSPKSRFRIKQSFKLSLEPFKKRLNVLNDQMDFYFENKKAAVHLKSISESLQKLTKLLE